MIPENYSISSVFNVPSLLSHLFSVMYLFFTIISKFHLLFSLGVYLGSLKGDSTILSQSSYGEILNREEQLTEFRPLFLAFCRISLSWIEYGRLFLLSYDVHFFSWSM